MGEGDGVAAAAAAAQRQPWLTQEQGTARGRGQGVHPDSLGGRSTAARLPPVMAHPSPGSQLRQQHPPQRASPTQAAASPSLTTWGEFPQRLGGEAAQQAATLPQQPRQQQREDRVPHCQQRQPMLPPPAQQPATPNDRNAEAGRWRIARQRPSDRDPDEGGGGVAKGDKAGKGAWRPSAGGGGEAADGTKGAGKGYAAKGWGEDGWNKGGWGSPGPWGEGWTGACGWPAADWGATGWSPAGWGGAGNWGSDGGGG